MHFHDSFIAYFFLVVSLSCCHKQTSSVPLFFIIHKSNNVESEERERERELLSAVAYEDQDCVSLRSATLLARTFLLHFALCSYPSVVFCPKDPSYGLPTSPLPGRRCCRLSTGQTGENYPLLPFIRRVANPRE